MKWTEVINDAAWVVDDLLTREECEYFLEQAMSRGLETSQPGGDVRHRDSTRMSLDNQELADRVFKRIKDSIPQQICVDHDCANNGLKHSKDDLIGSWRPVGLNYRWRIICYPGTGHFGPHRDGCHVVDEHHRSLITVNGYLTDRPVGFGGATRFVRDDLDIYVDGDGKFTTKEEDVILRVEADKAGKAVVFLHDLMHDGEPLKEGSPPKWLFRTEVIYERDPSTAPKLTSDQLEARKCIEEAELAESRGDLQKAMRLYSRAYRMDPSLESPAIR